MMFVSAPAAPLAVDFLPENIGERHVEASKNVFDAAQCGGLLPVDQPVKSGFGNAQLPGEARITLRGALDFQKFGKRPVKAGHCPTLANFSFRMRMMFFCAWRIFLAVRGTGNSSVQMAARLRKKLLFVDDDPEMHSGMRFILDTEYDLTCVFSGEEAVAAAASEVFPVVLLDLQMKGLSGLETLKLLLKAENEPQKVIILTGHDTKESAIKALNLGAFRYLLKPFQKDELQDTLQAAFERYRFERDVLVRPKQISSDYLKELGLSRRSVEIALLAAQGESNREIATQLEITERTVEKQMQGIFFVLNVSSRAKLIVTMHGLNADRQIAL